MRHLLQPQVLKAAGIASIVSTLACYPRLALWLTRPDAIWFLELNLFVCSMILWGGVFAWHAPYTGRPVFTFKMEPGPLAVATLTALGMAAVDHLWLDPALRLKFPEDYPPDLGHWLAAVPFSFALIHLFLVFAPCDWVMRLTRNRWVAMILTGLFTAGVQALRIHKLTEPISPWLAMALLALRFAGGFLAVWFYLRGGVLLVWWWAFILECRHLINLGVGR